MILITNFSTTSTKYYTYQTKIERQMAIFAIIKDFMKVHAHYYLMDSDLKNLFLCKDSLSKGQIALAELDEKALFFLPKELQEDAVELRERVNQRKEKWNVIRETMTLANELISLPKETALYFRQQNTSQLAIDKVSDALSLMIEEGLFHNVVTSSLYHEVKESKY